MTFAELSVIEIALYKSRQNLFQHIFNNPNYKFETDTLYHAINDGKEEVVEQILEYME